MLALANKELTVKIDAYEGVYIVSVFARLKQDWELYICNTKDEIEEVIELAKEELQVDSRNAFQICE